MSHFIFKSIKNTVFLMSGGGEVVDGVDSFKVYINNDTKNVFF